MPIVRPSKADRERARREIDWRALDLRRDAAVDAATDPDAAPDMTTALEARAFRRVDPASGEVDVVAIRARSGLSQSAFAQRFGLDLRALQDWEQGRRKPTHAATSYLRVIDKAPDIVAAALSEA